MSVSLVGMKEVFEDAKEALEEFGDDILSAWSFAQDEVDNAKEETEAFYHDYIGRIFGGQMDDFIGEKIGEQAFQPSCLLNQYIKEVSCCACFGC